MTSKLKNQGNGETRSLNGASKLKIEKESNKPTKKKAKK